MKDFHLMTTGADGELGMPVLTIRRTSAATDEPLELLDLRPGKFGTISLDFEPDFGNARWLVTFEVYRMDAVNDRKPAIARLFFYLSAVGIEGDLIVFNIQANGVRGIRKELVLLEWFGKKAQ